MAELGKGGLNGWFGETWHAPACEPQLEVPTPVGETCLWCDEPIDEGHRGFTQRYYDGKTATVVPMHLECSLRQIMGGALCADGTCENCGDGQGGAISDPPGLTMREAAIAAVAALERKTGRQLT